MGGAFSVVLLNIRLGIEIVECKSASSICRLKTETLKIWFYEIFHVFPRRGTHGNIGGLTYMREILQTQRDVVIKSILCNVMILSIADVYDI